MKKIIATAMLLATFSSLHAQEFGFGIFGGVMRSNFASSSFNSKPLTGPNLGIQFIAQMGDRFDLMTEFAYGQKGAVIETKTYDPMSNTLSPAADYDFKIKNYSWGLLGNFYIKAPNLSIQVGPVLSMNTAKPVIVDEDRFIGNSDNPNEVININSLQSELKKFEPAIAFGLSGGSEYLRINARYVTGLKNHQINSANNSTPFEVKTITSN